MRTRDSATATGAVWSALASAVSQALSFLVFVILARMMGPADYGLIALSMTVILVIAATADLGLGKLLVQRFQPADTEVDTAFLFSMLTGLLLALTLWLSAPFLADLLNTPGLAPVMRALVLVVVLKASGVVPRALMIRDFKFRALATRNILAVAVGGATGISMAVNGYGVWALVSQEIAKACVSTLGLWLASGYKPGAAVSLHAGRRMLRCGLPIMGTEINRIAGHHLDRFLIGGVLGVVSLGIYTIAAKVNRIAVTILHDSLSGVGLPSFARVRGDRARLRVAYYQSQRIGSAVTLPAFTTLALTAHLLVPLLLGPQWTASVPVLQMLCLASCAGSIGVFNAPLLLAIGRGDVVFRLSLFNVSSGVFAFFVAVHWGILGVSVAIALRAWLILPLEFILCRRYGEIALRPIWSGLTARLCALVPMVVAVAALPPLLAGWHPWLLLSATLLTAAVCYSLTLLLTDRELARLLLRVPALLRAGNY